MILVAILLAAGFLAWVVKDQQVQSRAIYQYNPRSRWSYVVRPSLEERIGLRGWYEATEPEVRVYYNGRLLVRGDACYEEVFWLSKARWENAMKNDPLIIQYALYG